MRNDTIAGVVGWIVGILAALFTIHAMVGSGGGALPPGRYPIIFLALIFLGPPVIAGSVAGGITFAILNFVLDRFEDSRDKARGRRREQKAVDLSARLMGMGSIDRRRLETEIVPELTRNGFNLQDRLTDDGRTALHLAAQSGNEALVEAIAETGPAYLVRSGQKLFFEAAAPELRERMKAAFVRGYCRFIEGQLLPGDRPVTDDDRVAVEKYMTRAFEAARPAFDLNILKRDVIAEARCIKGARAYDDNRPADAMELLNSAIRLDPNYHQAFNIRGLSYAELGRHADAIRDYDEALRIKPDYARAHYNRAGARRDSGDTDGALVGFNEAIRLDPDYVNALIDRGALHINKRNDSAAAAADFRRVLVLKPDHQLARENLDFVYRKTGADDETLARLDNTLAATPNDADALARRANVWRLRGDAARALADAAAALAIEPENKTALLTRGNVRLNANELDQALADYQRIARSDPSYAAAHFNCGIVFGRLGRTDEAIKAYRRVLELEPGAADAAASLKRLGATA